MYFYVYKNFLILKFVFKENKFNRKQKKKKKKKHVHVNYRNENIIIISTKLSLGNA